MAKLTLELCAIASPTGDEQRLGDHIAEHLHARGIAVERFGPAVVSRVTQRGRPLVLLVGHLDTVPATSDDSTPRIADGRVYGRGASDMKSGLATMLCAAHHAAQFDFDLGLVFYDREEGPFDRNGLTRVLAGTPWLRESALAICLEPSDNRVQLGCMGNVHAQLTFHGTAAHSARPWQGENAIHKAGPLLEQIARMAPRDHDVQGFAFRDVMSVTLASGGTTRNVVPDHFELNLNYRFSPARTLAEAEADIHALVAGRCDVRFVDRCPSGALLEANHPLLQRFLERTQATVTAKQAWTDVSQLMTAGIPAMNWGPGTSAQAHQRGEWTDLATLDAGLAMLERFMGTA